MAGIVMMCAGSVKPTPPGVKLPIGAYLMAFDPEHNQGQGRTDWTWDINEALVFESLEAAVTIWMTVSVVRPACADGTPNRPLAWWVIAYQTVAQQPARRAA